MVNLPPVGRLIPARDEPSEGDVIRSLRELDRLITGGAAVHVELRGKHAAFRGLGTDGQ